MQASFTELGAAMKEKLGQTPFPNNIAEYQQQLKLIDDLRKGVAGVSPGFNLMAQASGAFSVETVKAASATQSLSKSIADQKLSLSGALKNLNNFKAAWREQAQLQQSSMMQWKNSGIGGKQSVDLYVPTGAGAELDSFSTKYGYINKAIGSIATQTINWGKNTQWAGRQITVGIGMPIAMVMAAMTKMAYSTDKELTNIAKVYNTTADSTLTADQNQAVQAKQLKDVRVNAMQDSITLAKQYGQSQEETLKLEADLAALGKTGNDLRTTTAQVTKVATLGELDHNTALQMSISLMNAFQLSGNKLSDAFNYMNSVENATSLTTQDFAEALPRGAAAMAAMGMNVQEMGVLLVALKQGGVDATEGMNGLKSATSKLLNPSADAIKQFQGMNINIQQVVASAGGDLFKVLGTLSMQMKNQSAQTRETALAALFGTYQFGKLTTVVDGLGRSLGGLGDQSDQVTQAINIWRQGAASWQSTADQEAAALANSVSGQWQRAIETIKAQMGQMGQGFLAMLLPVGKAVAAVVTWFNSWGDGAKKFMMWFALAVAAAGPLIMFIGLLGNLVGQLGKFGSTIGNLVLRFRILDPEQRAQELMAKRAADAFAGEAGAIATLTQEMQKLIAIQAQAHGLPVPNTQQQVAQQAPLINGLTKALPVPKAVTLANGQTRYQASMPSIDPTTGRTTFTTMNNGRFISKQDVANMQAARQAQADMDAAAARQAAAAQKTGKSLAGAAMSVGMFIGGAVALKGAMDSSGGLAGNLAQAAIAMSMLAGSGAIGGMINGIKALPTAAKAGFNAVGTFAAKSAMAASAAYGRAGGSIIKVLGSGLASLGSFLVGPLGIISVLAIAGATIATMRAHLHDAGAEQDKVNDSAKAWATTLGFTAKSYGNLAAANAQAAATPNQWQARAEEVDKLTAANGALVKSLKEAAKASDNFESVYQAALAQAVKVRLNGGNVQEALRAFDVALQAAGLKPETIQNLHYRVEKVDLDNPDDLMKQVTDGINNVFNGNHGGVDNGNIGASWWRRAIGGNHPGEISSEAEKMAHDIGGKMADALGNAVNADQESSIVKNSVDGFNKYFSKDLDDSMGGLKDQFAKAGITSMSAFYKEANAYKQKYGELALTQPGTVDKSKLSDTDKVFNDWLSHVGASSHIVQQFGTTWDNALGPIRDKLKLSDDQMKEIKDSGYDAATMAKVFGEATLTMGGDATQAAGDVLKLATAVDNMHFNADQIVQAMQTAYQGHSNFMFQQADNLWQEHNADELKAIQRGGEKAQKALDARGKALQEAQQKATKDLEKAQKLETDQFNQGWDAKQKALDDQATAVKDNADAQVKAIQDQIDAETKADDIRQKLFDREKTRLDRLAQTQNDQIDFSTALAKGDLSEATKVYNTHSSTVQGWAIDDQNSAAADRLKDQTDGQKAQQDLIKANADAATKAIQQTKDANDILRKQEEDAMQERQQAAKDELAETQKAATDALQAKKDAQTVATQNATDEAQKRQKIAATELQEELLALKSSKPTTIAEMNDQQAKIEEIYQKYGLRLQGYGAQWTGIIGDDLQVQIAAAANGLESDIEWAQLGNAITQLIGSGAGMTLDQMKSFLTTGVWPLGVSGNMADPSNRSGKTKNNGPMHGGGLSGANGKVSWTQKERMGIPANAEPYQTEIPTLLKHGEFVVNAASTAANLGLLQAINDGGPSPMVARHGGGRILSGLAGTAQGIATAFGLTQTAALARGIWNNVSRLSSLNPNGGVNVPNAAPTDVTGNKKIVMDMAAQQYGWTGREWDALYKVIMMESGFQNAVKNPSGSAYGMFQFLDSTWAGYGIPKTSDPTQQTIAGLRYIQARYKDPLGALAHEQQFHWYDKGGYLKPGATMTMNATGKPEPVFTSEQWDVLSRLVSRSVDMTSVLSSSAKDNVAAGTSNSYDITVDLRGAVVRDEIDFRESVQKALYEIENKNGRNRTVGTR